MTKTKTFYKKKGVVKRTIIVTMSKSTYLSLFRKSNNTSFDLYWLEVRDNFFYICYLLKRKEFRVLNYDIQVRVLCLQSSIEFRAKRFEMFVLC